jgi:hypothetical protein
MYKRIEPFVKRKLVAMHMDGTKRIHYHLTSFDQKREKKYHLVCTQIEEKSGDVWLTISQFYNTSTKASIYIHFQQKLYNYLNMHIFLSEIYFGYGK